MLGFAQSIAGVHLPRRPGPEFSPRLLLMAAPEHKTSAFTVARRPIPPSNLAQSWHQLHEVTRSRAVV